MKERITFNPKSIAPATAKGLGILAFLASIIFLFMIIEGAVFIFFIGLILLFFSSMVLFATKELEVVDCEKGIFRISNGIGKIRYGKIRNLNEYGYGVVKKISLSYSSPGLAGPTVRRSGGYVESFWGVFFYNKNKRELELIYRGEMKEINRILSNFDFDEKFKVYKGARKKGYELKIYPRASS